MARGVFSSLNYFRATTSLITATPFTLACWVNTNSVAATQWMVGVGYTSGVNTYVDGWQLGLTNTGLVKASVYDGVSANSGSNAGAVTANVWCHAAAMFRSTTYRLAYTNGTAGTANTASRVPANAADTFQIGAIRYASNAHFGAAPNCLIAEVGFWNVELTAAEILELAAGYSPLFVCPESLVAYYPLIRGDASGDEPDYMGGLKMVEQGTVAIAAHARVFYPSSPITLGVPAAAPPAGQPMSARGVFVPGMRQWQPGRQPGL